MHNSTQPKLTSTKLKSYATTPNPHQKMRGRFTTDLPTHQLPQLPRNTKHKTPLKPLKPTRGTQLQIRKYDSPSPSPPFPLVIALPPAFDPRANHRNIPVNNKMLVKNEGEVATNLASCKPRHEGTTLPRY